MDPGSQTPPFKKEGDTLHPSFSPAGLVLLPKPQDEVGERATGGGPWDEHGGPELPPQLLCGHLSREPAWVRGCPLGRLRAFPGPAQTSMSLQSHTIPDYADINSQAGCPRVRM